MQQIKADLMEKKNMTAAQASNMIYSGGLSIYCNLDPDAQAAVEAAYEDPSLLGNKVSSDGLPIKSLLRWWITELVRWLPSLGIWPEDGQPDFQLCHSALPAGFLL